MYAAVLLLLAAEPSPEQEKLAEASDHLDKREFRKALASLDACLKINPKMALALDARGATHFMLGEFKKSADDFDAFLKVRPDAANGHWRRGISLYYAGRYDDGKKQFEGYEKVDTNDVENAVWHFLCAAKKDGLKAARAGVLKIGKDARSPMMKVYELFQGKCVPADVLKEAGKDERALFYAHLYLGLYHDATGDAKKAAEHLRLAGGKYRIANYMGDVARVHHELYAKDKAAKRRTGD